MGTVAQQEIENHPLPPFIYSLMSDVKNQKLKDSIHDRTNFLRLCANKEEDVNIMSRVHDM
jgi:hypothetical protein